MMTAKEAVSQWMHLYSGEACRIEELAAQCYEYAGRRGEWKWVAVTMYNAGRIDGIRQERQRRKADENDAIRDCIASLLQEITGEKVLFRIYRFVKALHNQESSTEKKGDVVSPEVTITPEAHHCKRGQPWYDPRYNKIIELLSKFTTEKTLTRIFEYMRALYNGGHI